VIERLRAWYRRIQRKMCEYPVSDTEQVSLVVGVDDRGVVHAVTWRFVDAEGVLQGLCGATTTLRTRGTVDCMTCLVKEPR
jgi:hypothetical protein